MPQEIFGPGYQFLRREEILSFEEIARTVRVALPLGLEKVRLTGGEPLLRRGVDDLVAMVAGIEGVRDLAMTTNGVLLGHHAEGLVAAGLHRVTVSLDALDEKIFGEMNGVGAKVGRVLGGIEAALASGLPVKVNMVVQKGRNEGEILPVLKWCLERGVVARFIEFMDVGETNGWERSQVMAAAEVVALIGREMEIEAAPASHFGETARRWKLVDGTGEFGVIASVTQAFCRSCTRLRLSAEGRVFTCLFAGSGHDWKRVLRSTADESELRSFLEGIWTKRDDRYSELRGEVVQAKAEMSYLGG